MQQQTVQVSISFEALAAAVSSLSLADKIRLWDLLEDDLTAIEDANPDMHAAIQRALDEYAAGDVMTLEEYRARQKEE